jgi:hypothetical protein
VYPGRENKVVLTIQPLGLLEPYRARWAWAPYKAALKPGDCLPLVNQHLVPEKGAGKHLPLCQLVGNPSCIHFVSWLGIHRVSTLSVGWESIVYSKKRKKVAVHESPIMPRAGARTGETGDAGEAAGSKVRSTEAQTNNRDTRE